MKGKPEFLTPDQCCLYIVDPQERLMAHIHGADQVEKNISLMVRLAKVFNIPIIVNTQYKKGIGPLVASLADGVADLPCPDKTEFNGLANPEVRQLFEELPSAVDTVLLCGVETHICIYQSGMGLLREGYRVRLVADGVSSRSPENDALGKQRLQELGAVLAPAEMIIYEFLQKAGTPAFKEMLPYLK